MSKPHLTGLKDFSFSNDYIEITKHDSMWIYKVKNMHPEDNQFIQKYLEIAKYAYDQCNQAIEEFNNDFK